MKVAFANATGALEREGCDAAGYRLAGEGVDKLCVIHLWGRWRLVLAFPEVDVALVVDVGEHLDNDRSRDVYTRLYEALDVNPPTEARGVPGLMEASKPRKGGAMPAPRKYPNELRERARRLVSKNQSCR